MGQHQSYEERIKGVYKGLILLAVVTLIEVFVSLFGKGHLGYLPTATWLLAAVGIALIVLSLYKAYFIIYEFMHMGDEVRGLRLSVLMPCLLLVWAIIAFFHEGNAWFERRDQIKQKNERSVDDVVKKEIQGFIYQPEEFNFDFKS
ncbi:MAG: cytochrome C oxidase subunit IV family protein [Bacteroidota bacterium]